MKELKVKVFNVISADIENVYSAWLNPESLSSFLLPEEDTKISAATLDPQVNGRYSVTMVAHDGSEILCSGEYLILEPFSQIVFSWASPFVTNSTVTLNFSTVDEGTRIELIHKPLPDQGSKDDHKAGWYRVLGELDKLFS